MIEGIPMQHVLIVSLFMFFAGVCGFIIRKNMITILMSVELILNAVNINLLVFNKYLFPEQLQGHFFALFVMGIAAAEAAVAIALIINIYRRLNSINVEEVTEMKY